MAQASVVLLYMTVVNYIVQLCTLLQIPVGVLRLLLLLEMCPHDNYIGTCRRCSVTFRVCNTLEGYEGQVCTLKKGGKSGDPGPAYSHSWPLFNVLLF